jgi:hypothetical protein
MYGYHKVPYAAQEMLGTYQSGQTVGNPLTLRERGRGSLARKNDAGAAAAAAAEGGGAMPWGALAQAGAALLGTGIGIVSGGTQAKKNRAHETEMAEYNLQAQGLAAKTAALQSQAAAAIASVDAKKAATYAAYGMGTVVLLGAMTFSAVLILKKRKQKRG